MHIHWFFFAICQSSWIANSTCYLLLPALPYWKIWDGRHRVGAPNQILYFFFFFFFSVVLSTVALYVPHCNRMKLFCSENKILEVAFFSFSLQRLFFVPATQLTERNFFKSGRGPSSCTMQGGNGRERRNYKRMNKLFLFKFVWSL